MPLVMKRSAFLVAMDRPVVSRTVRCRCFSSSFLSSVPHTRPMHVSRVVMLRYLSIRSKDDQEFFVGDEISESEKSPSLNNVNTGSSSRTLWIPSSHVDSKLEMQRGPIPSNQKPFAEQIHRPELQATIFVPGTVGSLPNLLAIVREAERRYGPITEYRCPTVRGEYPSVFGARIFIRFESPESTARLPPAFAPASEKARCRFEVPSTLPSPSWSDPKRGRFDETALGVKEQNSNVRNSDPPVRPEHVGWGGVRDLLRPVRLSNNGTDKIGWEKLDKVTTSDSSEIRRDAVHDHDHSSSAPGSSAGRVLSCEITRASEGATSPSPRAHPLSRTKFTPAELNNLVTPRARRAAAALSILRGFSLWDHQGQVLQNTTSEIFNVGTKDSDGRRELQSSCQPRSNPVARKDPLDSPSDSSSFPRTSLPPSYVSPCRRRPPTSSPPEKTCRNSGRSGAYRSSSSDDTAPSPSESVDNAFRVDSAVHHPLTRGIETGTECDFGAGGVGASIRHTNGGVGGGTERAADMRMHPLIVATRARWAARVEKYGTAVGVHHHSHTGVKHTVSEPRTTSSRLKPGTRLSSQK